MLLTGNFFLLNSSIHSAFVWGGGKNNVNKEELYTLMAILIPKENILKGNYSTSNPFHLSYSFRWKYNQLCVL